MDNIQLTPATLSDYPLIQNMARFYLYDLSRYCGQNSEDWALPQDGLYESFDFKNYFEDPDRKAFLIRADHEVAGFALLNQATTNPNATWNIGEFFILARFQRHKIGQKIAHQLFRDHPALWEISVIPENTPAISFWGKVISSFTNGCYSEKIKEVSFDEVQPQRVIFSFNTEDKKN